MIIKMVVVKYCLYFSEKSVPQIALKWLLQKPCVPSVVVGVTALEQLENNIGAAGEWQLTQQQVTMTVFLLFIY